MYFETFILTILFKNAKMQTCKIEYQKKKKKFSQFLGRSEKCKQTFFLGLSLTIPPVGDILF